MKEILRVENLSFSYDDEPVLKNISFSLNEGEKLALLGQNGSGKSTLFLCLNGVLTPQSGRVFLDGKEIKYNHRGKRDLRKKTGLVFQDSNNQIIAPTVIDELGFGPLNLNVPEAEVRERINLVAEKLNLKSLLYRPPHYLSGGELKRVTIGDILTMKPEIILLDEPANSLDPKEKENLIGILDSLHHEKKAVILSTHMVDLAWEWAEKTGVLIKGRLAAIASPGDIFRDHKLIKEAHLKQPLLFKITELLVKEKIISEPEFYPRNFHELEKLVGNQSSP